MTSRNIKCNGEILEEAKFNAEEKFLQRLKLETKRFDQSYVYEKRRPIGVGSQGTVRLCRAKKSGRWVACKTMNFLKRNNRSIIHLRQEVTMHRRCSSHPFVVTLHDAFETDKEISIVMEYCQGGTLTELILQHPNGLPLDLAQNLMKQLAQVLAYVHHDKGVIHRDIKTENILLSADQTSIRLVDFGLATEIEQEEEDKSGEMRDRRGTHGFMAPEVLRREVARPANDIWSAGVVLCTMLTGNWPFDLDKSEEELAHTDCSGDVGFWNKNLPEDAKHLVMRMLDFNPETRICALEILEHPWFRQSR